MKKHFIKTSLLVSAIGFAIFQLSGCVPVNGEYDSGFWSTGSSTTTVSSYRPHHHHLHYHRHSGGFNSQGSSGFSGTVSKNDGGFSSQGSS